MNPYTEDHDEFGTKSTLDTTNLKTQWLAASDLRSTLQSISMAWFHRLRRPPAEDLALIRREVWDAQCHLQPFPDVVVTSMQETVLGVLCGYRDYHQPYFFIQHIAIHPACTPRGTTLNDSLMIRQVLVTAAIDLSISMGCHGWLATVPHPSHIPLWVQLGFAKYDEFTFRRMGYFS